MNKKKIAVIGLKGLPAFGGSARAGESVINRLKDKYIFTVYSISSHTKFKGQFNGILQIVFKSYKNYKFTIILYYLKSALHCLFKGDYDLVHINHGNSGFIVPLLKLKYPVITTLRGSGENTEKYDKLGFIGKKLFFFTEYLILKFSDIVISVSKPHLEYYNKRVCRKVIYIPNGIDVNAKVKIIDSSDQNYILFAASRIIKIKGCHLFLQALHKINYFDQVLIIGDLTQNISYKKEIENLVRNLNVKFLGLIKDKAILLNYIDKAKLFVFPSIIEAMSNMLLEAASMKTPIICSDIPENKAIFEKDESLFFKSENVDDLTNKIQFALANPNEMLNKTNKAYKKLINDYNWDNIAREYEILYDKLVTESD